jgi:Lon protease-like protein
MIEDLLDGPGQLVMGTVEQRHASNLAESPPVRPIAGIGEICRHERLPDGRFLIWLFGLSRVRIREVSSDRPYRRVTVEPIQEIAPPSEREEALRKRLRKAILASCEGEAKIPDEIPIACLADLLLQRLALPQSKMEELYEEIDVETRAECGLELHASRPSPPRS